MGGFALRGAQRLPPIVISSFSVNAAGPGVILNPGGSVNNAFPTANMAFFYPFVLDSAVTIVKLGTLSGGTLSGNIDVGIYDDAFSRIVSSGSTAQANAATIQEFDITDTLLNPGYYYLAVAMNNTTGTLRRLGCSIPAAVAAGVLEQASAFALPATASPVKTTQSYIVDMGAWQRTLV